jgi:mannose-6-phosphate isomerase-like protein (cupin superfamily)
VKSRVFLLLLTAATAFTSTAVAQSPAFLKRSLGDIAEQSTDLSSSMAHYKPLFGIGDPNAQAVKGLARFGHLAIDPNGTSRLVSYADEEQVYFVLEGTGLLRYAEEKAAIKKNDFVYVPVGVEHGVSNPGDKPLSLIVMGFEIPAGRQVPPTPRLMMASADDVALQVLGQHGPTTQFKLLMGTTRSTRDKLAAAQQINSLFIMDFAAGGTNIPHKHAREEEIYFVLHGQGDMVAGTDAEGKDVRHPAKAGDAFYFAPNTQIGFYSGAKEGQDHDLILAVRWPVPSGS